MKCFEGGDVVAALEPAVEQCGSARAPASAHSSRTTRSMASTIARSPSSSTRRSGIVAGVEVAITFDRVVEPQHRRASHPAAGCDGRRRGRRRTREPEGGARLRRRRRVHPQARAGDDAEGALAADEQLSEVRSDRGAWRAAGVHAATVGDDHVETEHHVLDLPVAGGYCPALRHANQPPTVERSIDWGQWPRVT